MPPSAATPDLGAALAETRRNQAAAADPAASAWVSANAGTGKTHVLTMRMLRLLLAGAEPARILALTYTKAAAAEMATRVAARLAEWVTAGDADLGRRLTELLDREPSVAEMKRARQLFALVIETPGGLKVQTIHAFCERLLQRFPLEAGVPPGFEILDDHTRAALLEEATNQVLTDATTAAPGSSLAEALATAIAFAAETNFDTYLAEALRQRDWLEAAASDLRAHLAETLGRREWLEAAARLEDDAGLGLAETQKLYRGLLGLGPDASFAATSEKLAGLLTKAQLTQLRTVLAEGSSSDGKASERIAAALASPGAAGRIAALSQAFLTDGKPRKSVITKGLAAKYPDVADLLQSAQDRFVALYDERCKAQLMEATLALVRLGNAVMQRYSEVKARHARLDFDDLIDRAANLLRTSGAVDWVLYKLDGGLDHILVDEAQDTSPVQWEVITALADEFLSGRGAREETRTLFAVGDEKQSIYSFQGAAPKMFAAQGEVLGIRAQRAGLPWRRVPLTLSFRSVEPLLAAVDAVFARPDRTPGVGSSAVRHIAHRAGHAGLIEIWPTEKHEAPSPAEAWSPLDETSATPAVVRLANRIADTIAGWLQAGDMLASENRPVRAGDILVLVRKRLPFAPALVSALKARRVPVAGADRLMLTEQVAVQDLMALGDALTLPEDDLALAAVLKSPLFGLDDADLMTLAHDRAGSLWEQLQARQIGDGTTDRFVRAAEALRRWQPAAEREPPFEFYAGVLDREGGRSRMLARLGSEAADAIDEFLNLALVHDDGAPPSLQGFLCRLRQGQREIKRDMEQGRDEVRVMTVHGAKGLEAPIVFLPDTCSTRSARQANSLLTLESVERPSGLPPPFLWPVKGTSKVQAVQDARVLVNAAETEERNRLLYVALTRARDRLYVAGFEGAQRPPANCWYHLIKDGLAGLLEEVADADGCTVWQMRSLQTVAPAAGKTRAEAATEAGPLPAWATTPAPPEPLITQPLIPSRLAPFEAASADERGAPSRERRHVEPAVLSPSQMTDDSRFVRGNLTHALLEHLPQVPQRGWAAAAEAFLARHGAQLTPKARRDVAAETLAILQDPALAALFGPHSRAEVPIAAQFPHPDGIGPALRLTGKIDRLVKTDTSVLILDYKTNRPPPADPESVAEAYLLQLAAYRLGVSQIFPGTKIEAAILWTDGPRLMKMPAGLLDRCQSRLWERAAG